MAEKGPTLAELESVLGPETNETAADTMRAVMEELGSKETDAAADQGTRGTAGAVTTEADERTRDEHGRFVKAGADAGEKPGETRDVEDGKTEADEDDTDAVIEPPAAWTVDEQTAFRKLTDPALQKFVLDRATKADEALAHGTRYKALDDILAPRREALARDGMDDVAAVRQLFALSDLANRKPDEFIAWFAGERGIDLGALVAPKQPNGAGAEDQYADPETQRLAAQNRELQARLDRLEGTVQSREQQAETAQQQQVRADFDRFAAETDEKGRPVRPYLQEVRPLMGTFLRSGDAPDFQTAYDMACRAHTGVNAKIAAAAQAAAERDRAKEQRRKAEAAKQAGSSITGTPGDRAPPAPTGDLREDMRRMFAERGMLS